MIAVIYILEDPISSTPKYIGYTTNMLIRFKNHLYDKSKTHKVNWIKKLNKLGLIPSVFIVDKVNVDDAKFWEMHYISLYKSWGFNLVNGTFGGDGTSGIKRIVTKETLLKISNAVKPSVKRRAEHLKNIGLYERHRIKMSGILNPMKNKDIAKKSHLKMSASVRKPVIQMSKDGCFIKEWPGIKDAADNLLIQESSINKCCNKKGGYKSAGGFLWVKKSDYLKCTNC